MASGKLYEEFGRLVRLHRERMGLTQADIGKRVGLSRTSITNIERGRQKVLFHQVFDIARSLQVNPEALLPQIIEDDLSSERLSEIMTGEGLAEDPKFRVWFAKLTEAESD